MNIKRDGAFAGEYLFYTVGPALPSVPGRPATSPSLTLGWELNAKNTNRSLWIEADRETLRPLVDPRLKTNDDLGVLKATPFKGPAIDDEGFGLSHASLASGRGLHHEAAGDRGAASPQPDRDEGNGDRSCPGARRQVQLLQGVVWRLRTRPFGSAWAGRDLW